MSILQSRSFRLLKLVMITMASFVTNTFLILKLASTMAMVGLIWFVQLVHYPLFAKVGAAGFAEYERLHQTRTTWVVAPLMLTEAVTAVGWIWLRPAAVPALAAVAGALLVGVLWLSTYWWQIPAHRRLTESFDPLTHQRLVRSNWLRTAVWTARGALVCWMSFQPRGLGPVSSYSRVIDDLLDGILFC